jgi:CRISPR-associated protein Csb2
VNTVRTLVLYVRTHDGRYHGTPDWPPAPARLFQALVAGVAGAGKLADPDRIALEWLETLPPPVIAAPIARQGQGIIHYVPNNDLDSKEGDFARIGEVRAAKAVKPHLFDAEIPFLYAWSYDSDNASDESAGRVCHIANYLYQFGRGVDMAWAWGEILNAPQFEPQLNDYAGVLHHPYTFGGSLLACPEVDSLKSLLERHAAQRMRFTTINVGKKSQQIFAQPPKPRFKQVGYNSSEILQLYDLGPGSVQWPFTRCADLVTCVRDAAVRKLSDALPDRRGEIERILIGRGATEADKAARVCILPLPSIGHPHADRAIRRILVRIPPNCSLHHDDIAWAVSGLTLEVDSETGEVLRELIPATDSRMLGHYGVKDIANRYWRTVTPAALSVSAARERIALSSSSNQRRAGAARLVEQSRAAAAVLQSLRHAGIRSRVDEVRVQREPFEAKGERAEAFGDGTRFAKGRLWHVAIRFSEPPTAPLVIGDGRYQGLGLMAPEPETGSVDGLHCLQILSGLANSASAVACAQALRRAVMASAQYVMGTRSRLPTYFTGHEADGAPARGGRHAHLAFVADLARRRLIVVAPHVLERRAPWPNELRWLKTLYSAVSGITDLRVGMSGHLKLVPSPIDPNEDPLFSPARCWESVTRYSPTRHARRVPANEALVADFKTEIQRLALPDPARVEVIGTYEGPRGGLAGKLRLHFSTAVTGLILVGRTRHFGGGLFASVNQARTAMSSSRDAAVSHPQR